MDLALFDFDGTITRDDTFSSFDRFAVRPTRKVVGGVLLIPVVAGYRLHVVSASRTRPMVGDTIEDRDMLGLAHRKYYRLKEIGDWTDATPVRG